MIQPKDELIRDIKISGIKKQVAECINAAFSKGYETCFEQKKEIEDRAYQKGLEDAWEVIRRLMLTSAEGGITTDELTKLFNTGVYSIIRDRSIYEVKEKIEAWEQKQKQEEAKERFREKLESGYFSGKQKQEGRSGYVSFVGEKPQEQGVTTVFPDSPCDLCVYNPPSAGDGKPCTMCPAEGKVEE